jgi:hypothetical protein
LIPRRVICLPWASRKCPFSIVNLRGDMVYNERPPKLPRPKDMQAFGRLCRVISIERRRPASSQLLNLDRCSGIARYQ